MLNDVLSVFSGQEVATGKTDPRHRSVHAEFLRGQVDEWISRIPLGHVEAFTDKLAVTARAFIESFPPERGQVVDRRTAELMWDRIRAANARKILVPLQSKKTVLTDITVSDKHAAVKSPMANLLDRLNEATIQRGMKSTLAKFMGVPLANVSQWLSGEREPGGETTLRLLHWVEQQERHQTPLAVQPTPPRARPKSTS